MYSIDFLLTKQCNKKCYYCSTYAKIKEKINVDLVFLEFILMEFKNYSNDYTIKILGGEPGLIKNLNEIIKTIKKFNFNIEVYSNSLVRKNYPEILDDRSIKYVEHLFYMVKDSTILKLGDFNFLKENDKNNYNTVVMTNNFLSNFFKIDISELKHNNTIWKAVNTRGNDKSKVFNKKEIYTSLGIEEKKELTDKFKYLCSINTPNPVINFETKQIEHCSKYPTQSKTIDCTSKNIKKLLNSSLFETEMPEYCKNCVDPETQNRTLIKIKCKNGKPIN